MVSLLTSEIGVSASDRIIVPLDVPTLNQALHLVDQLPEVHFWKVGLELFVSSGTAIIHELKSRQKAIFLDLKFHDIPNTVVAACRSAAQWQADLLTVHATVGLNGLQQAQMALQATPTRLIAVTLLTSVNSQQLTDELGVSLDPLTYTHKMAQMAQSAGLPGVVCSPHEATSLRRLCGDDFLLVCPGVRPTWAESGDQKRVMTPAKALQSGANYLVIGRPITAASDPQLAFQRICEEITEI
jgi:orotidine-5'-phosphate decarboxylase